MLRVVAAILFAFCASAVAADKLPMDIGTIDLSVKPQAPDLRFQAPWLEGVRVPSKPSTAAPPPRQQDVKGPPSPQVESPKAPKAEPPPPKSATVERPTVIASDDVIGCRRRDVAEKLQRLAFDGDAEAFRKLLVAAVIAGACREMRSGAAVLVYESGVWSGIARVRVKGEIEEWFVSANGLAQR